MEQSSHPERESDLHRLAYFLVIHLGVDATPASAVDDALRWMAGQRDLVRSLLEHHDAMGELFKHGPRPKPAPMFCPCGAYAARPVVLQRDVAAFEREVAETLARAGSFVPLGSAEVGADGGWRFDAPPPRTATEVVAKCGCCGRAMDDQTIAHALSTPDGTMCWDGRTGRWLP